MATAIAVLVAAAAVAVGAWALRSESLAPPARVVDAMLELRHERSNDASAYAMYFADTDVAEALAADSVASEGTSSGQAAAIPRWERPYVSALNSQAADVVVIWIRNGSFENWARATVFKLETRDSAWKIVDAQEMTGSVPPEIPSDGSDAGR
jgi:hypothetical protein